MTDRLKGLVVAFVGPIREDDAKAIKNAIYQLRGVAMVSDLVDNPDDHVNREIVKREMTTKIMDALVSD